MLIKLQPRTFSSNVLFIAPSLQVPRKILILLFQLFKTARVAQTMKHLFRFLCRNLFSSLHAYLYALCSSALNIYKSNFSMFLNDIKSCFFVEINEFTEMELVRKSWETNSKKRLSWDLIQVWNSRRFYWIKMLKSTACFFGMKITLNLDAAHLDDPRVNLINKKIVACSHISYHHSSISLIKWLTF